MNIADPLTTSLVAACVAVLMVHAGIGKRRLVWRVAAELLRRPSNRPTEFEYFLTTGVLAAIEVLDDRVGVVVVVERLARGEIELASPADP